jgi:hypothetical protein
MTAIANNLQYYVTLIQCLKFKLEIEKITTEEKLQAAKHYLSLASSGVSGNEEEVLPLVHPLLVKAQKQALQSIVDELQEMLLEYETRPGVSLISDSQLLNNTK